MRDRSNEKLLRADGWQVLTIWECEAREAGLAEQRIAGFLKTRNSR